MKQTKYINKYADLISSAKSNKLNIEQNYHEVHHILPRCMGGSDEISNLVSLTPRQHFIAHWMLTRIYKETKILFAFNAMTRDGTGKRHFTSSGYSTARKLLGRRLSEERKGTWTVGKENGMYGKTYYQRWVELYGKEEADKRKEAYSIKMKESLKGKSGHPHSEETKTKMSKSKSKSYKLISPDKIEYIYEKTPVSAIAIKHQLHPRTLSRFIDAGKIPFPFYKNQSIEKHNTVDWEIQRI